MKKLLILFVFTILVCLPSTALANSYVNNNGVTMSEEQYNNLRKLYTEQYLSVLDPNKFNQIMDMDLDFDTLDKTVKYIKTEHNQVTGEITETLLTKEEYESVSAQPQTRATIIGTSYKQIELTLIKTSEAYNQAYFTFSAIWKIMPVVRSFDVIGVRFSNMTRVNGTQQGKQIYTLNGETDFVQYSFNGTNIQNFSNGFGISMNLLNSNITYLECMIDSSMVINAYPAGLFTSYQHAVEDVSLATSQNYTIGVGLGSVFVFNDGISSKYDGMEGTYDYFSN